MSVEIKDQILDAAERLFAVQGIDAVSLRTITHEAGLNLAVATYHFGSKETLVTQVFMRRIGEVNRERLRPLTEYDPGGCSNLSAGSPRKSNCGIYRQNCEVERPDNDAR